MAQTWLCRGYLNKETKFPLMAVPSISIRIHYNKVKMDSKIVNIDYKEISISIIITTVE